MHRYVSGVGTTQPWSPLETPYMGLNFARHDMPAWHVEHQCAGHKNRQNTIIYHIEHVFVFIGLLFLRNNGMQCGVLATSGDHALAT
jgi:hypothetical protein